MNDVLVIGRGRGVSEYVDVLCSTNLDQTVSLNAVINRKTFIFLAGNWVKSVVYESCNS